MAGLPEAIAGVRNIGAALNTVLRGVLRRNRPALTHRGASSEPARLPRKVVGALGRTVRRAVLVANNDRVNLRVALNDVPRADDLIVQFNRCMHFAHFLDAECAKLFVHREIAASGINWGYPPDRTAFDGIDPGRLRGDMSLLFIDSQPVPEAAPSALRDVARDPEAVSYAHASSAPFDRYPRAPFVPLQSPTSGFMILQFLLEERQRLREAGKPEFEIVLAGFSDTSTPKYWSGHNWTYERSFVDSKRSELIVVDGPGGPIERA